MTFLGNSVGLLFLASAMIVRAPAIASARQIAVADVSGKLGKNANLAHASKRPACVILQDPEADLARGSEAPTVSASFLMPYCFCKLFTKCFLNL